MTKLNGWKVLNEGQGGEVVLGVDFATTGRSDSSFSDLAPNLGHGLALWETRQPDGASAGSAEDFLGLWADGIAASGRTVRAVLATARAASTPASWPPGSPNARAAHRSS